MPAVYVVYLQEDRTFVEEWLLPPVAALGFDRFLIAQPLRYPDPSPLIERAAAVLVVVSARASASEPFIREADVALRSRTPIIPIYLTSPDPAAPSSTMRQLAGRTWIDARTAREPRDLWPRLSRLLPSPGFAPAVDPATMGRPTPWSAEAFSVLLDRSAERNDFDFGSVLVDAFTRHAAQRTLPYPTKNAVADLRVLRGERQFLLMRRYAAAAVGSGTTHFTVRRQYAQALIELKELTEAVEVLKPLDAEATHADDAERFEARGLLGRAWKQRYVDAPDRHRGDWLGTAITTYWTAFDEDDSNVWHGINAASCLRRAARDGVPPPRAVPSADDIARKVLRVLEGRLRAGGGRLDVWDSATRVEAYVDLDDLALASRHLDAYLFHPDIEPFEVSSTYRQFDELLQLRRSPDGHEILDRLAGRAERLRTGGLIGTRGSDVKQLLVRVADPGWAPVDMPDLVVNARLGDVVSVTGSSHTVNALIKDPVVIDIEESRPSSRPDCERSLPFVRVKETYQAQAGPFAERGAHALVAIIDDGIDVLHEAFLDSDGRSRIVGIWDQTDPDISPDNPAGVGFGHFHTADDIARYLHKQKVPESLSRNGSHGTHVASIAAGRRCGTFAGGVAPEARLLVVISNADEPTGYSTAHLAALAFIDQQATELVLPVVVNVSQGMNAGAHDGKSPLERTFDGFSDSGQKPGRIVVKSAGNERSRRGHAKLTVPPGGADDLRWRCPPGPVREVHLELWWDSANRYRFQFRSPTGDPAPWVDLHQPEAEKYFRGQGEYRLILTRQHTDNGDSLLRIQHRCGRSLRDGEWTLVVEAVKVCRPGDIHAWIERDGAEPLTEFVNHDTEEMTLSIPGTSHDVITVGAVDARYPVRTGAFSSFGPTRDCRDKPDICAPGVQIHAALQGSVNDVVAMDGTSMAAPHVTGAVALALSKAVSDGKNLPTGPQIKSRLKQNTIFRNAYWDRGQGFGILDVTALLEPDPDAD